jgi:hypothetical protein
LDKVNLALKFSLFHEQYQPKIVGEINDTYVKLVKLQGDFMWHHHDVEDELFFVVKGELRMKVRDDEGEREIVIHRVNSSSSRTASSTSLPPIRRRTSCCWNRRPRSTLVMSATSERCRSCSESDLQLPVASNT